MAAEWSSQYEFLKKRLQSLRLQRIEYSSDEVRGGAGGFSFSPSDGPLRCFLVGANIEFDTE